MNLPFLLPASLFVISLSIRMIYELLKESRSSAASHRAMFPLVFTAMVVLWTSWFILCQSDPTRVDLPGPAHWAGFGVFLLGTLLAVGALVQLRAVEATDHLVTRGLFRWIRHPMYTGFIAWFIGWSMFHGALIGSVLGLAGIVSVLWWRHLEERRLTVQFGEEYELYRKKTLV